MSVVTSITAQDTCGIAGVYDLPADFVRLQLDVVVRDIGVDGAKTGMLSSPEIIEVVASGIKEWGIVRLVVDPVIRAKSGHVLLREEARSALIELILPLAMLVTPNLPEAVLLSGRKIETVADMKECAKRILDYGPKAVLVKGGHLEEKKGALDVLYDGCAFYEMWAERIQTNTTHGTGCTYSAAITAYLARGYGLVEAVERAKHYVTGAIKHGFALGKGHGPLNHLWMQRV